MSIFDKQTYSEMQQRQEREFLTLIGRIRETEVLMALEKISRQLDDIAARLPMPAVQKEYKDIAFEKREGTGDGNFKYPTTYVSVQTKTSDSTND